VQSHWDRDPLAILERTLADDPRWQALQKEVDEEVARAAEAAERAAFGTIEPPSSADVGVSWRPLDFSEERTVRSVQRGLDAVLAADERVILIGEDIESPYGGAFKCTDQLSARYPGRVRNTPISELAIVGIGNGLALGGFRPVVEIMFGDFVTLALDQWVNHAAKFAFMFADKVTVPLVVRTPMGGKRGYGATHSQSLERHVVGVPGTRVLCLHHRYPAAELYRAIFDALDTPTFVMENKVLYGKTASAVAPNGYSLSLSDERFPTVRLSPPDSPQLTASAPTRRRLWPGCFWSTRRPPTSSCRRSSIRSTSSASWTACGRRVGCSSSRKDRDSRRWALKLSPASPNCWARPCGPPAASRRRNMPFRLPGRSSRPACPGSTGFWPPRWHWPPADDQRSCR
jgi:hypothetical protein